MIIPLQSITKRYLEILDTYDAKGVINEDNTRDISASFAHQFDLGKLIMDLGSDIELLSVIKDNSL